MTGNVVGKYGYPRWLETLMMVKIVWRKSVDAQRARVSVWRMMMGKLVMMTK